MAHAVVLARHGETEWSRTLRHTGLTDLPLTEEGRRQATALGPGLRTSSFSLVLTSPLQRALETCRLAGYGDLAQLRPDLVEWDYGGYEGLTSKQIEEIQPNWSLWRDGCPGGETAADVGRRADRVLAEVRRVDGDVLIFSHGHMLRVLASRWLGEPPADGRYYALQTATLSTLGYEHDAVIRQWNLPPS
ncbi:MAG: histidine phosphatase family protein [Candidatus Dormibacteraeota bacterium]|nr:histidine phosphatase family protein [Candidatus Dormibacteraeota bacterium]MDQ6885338.1 histidine phosphatase family protein [Candidatus Dormibacteraeota bacterium]